MSLEIVTFVGGPIQTNAYLVADTATGDALVIDAPHETASQIVEEAARRGWTIGQIVITHTHWDHVARRQGSQGGDRRAAAGASPGREPLANPTASFGEPPVEVPPVEIGRHARRRRYGDARRPHLHRHAPARARPVAHRARSTRAQGDLPRRRRPLPRRTRPTEIPGADQAVMNETLRRLVDELPATTTVLPGHGASTTIGAEMPWIRLLREG